MGDVSAEVPTTGAAAPAAEAPQPAVTFAKKQRRGNIRKRPQAEELEAAQLATEPAEPAVVRRAKASKVDIPMAFSTRRPAEDKEEVFTFESSRTIQQSGDSRATATLETETEFDRDARCVTQPPIMHTAL